MSNPQCALIQNRVGIASETGGWIHTKDIRNFVIHAHKLFFKIVDKSKNTHYNICKNIKKGIRNMDKKASEFYNKKREAVLREVDPICKTFGIGFVDYKLDTTTLTETLCIDGVKIGCTGNSIEAVVDELIAYIFVNRYCKHRDLGAFHKQTVNRLKRHWIE